MFFIHPYRWLNIRFDSTNETQKVVVLTAQPALRAPQRETIVLRITTGVAEPEEDPFP